MKTRIVIAAAVTALLAACGADESACTTTSAKLAEGQAVVPSTCTAAAGSIVTIPVNLCANCRATRAACQAEFLGGTNSRVEIDPIFYECEESTGCPLTNACENNPATRQVNCSVTIPANVSGPVPIIAAAGEVGSLEVTPGASSCRFAAVDLP